MLLPSESGKTRFSAVQNVIYCTVLLVVSSIPYYFNMVNWMANSVIMAVGAMFLWMAWKHYLKL
jgi:heme O synthase-like polyprenyltransferase